jgi:hypothetical protein
VDRLRYEALHEKDLDPAEAYAWCELSDGLVLESHRPTGVKVRTVVINKPAGAAAGAIAAAKEAEKAPASTAGA